MMVSILMLNVPMVVIPMWLDIKGRPNSKDDNGTEQEKVIHCKNKYFFLLYFSMVTLTALHVEVSTCQI